MNIFYFIVPIACLFLYIKGYNKKDRILKILRLNTGSGSKFIRISLIVLSLLFIAFSLLGPQTFKDFQEVNKTGLDIYILIDTSKSMLAEDIKPNRISRAKKTAEELINQLKGDRIGFIPYSSASYIQMPLTDDYQLAKMFLSVIDTDMIGGGGTDAGAAIRLASNSFDQTSSVDRVVIILSDGEEHNTDTLDVLKSLKDKNMKVFSIGIGTDKGGLIPVYDDTGKQRTDYKKDSKGQFVMSKLNSDMLVKIAEMGNGTYFQASSFGLEINQFIKDISNLKRDTLKTEKIKRFEEIYQYFLGIGILLFLLVYLLPERRKFA